MRPKNSDITPKASSGNRMAAETAAIVEYIGFGVREEDGRSPSKIRSLSWARNLRSDLVLDE